MKEVVHFYSVFLEFCSELYGVLIRNSLSFWPNNSRYSEVYTTKWFVVAKFRNQLTQVKLFNVGVCILSVAASQVAVSGGRKSLSFLLMMVAV